MEATENKFLGEAKISKLLLKFSVPCILSLLISALYNIVDQIFIGNSELDYLGNAATGIVFPVLIVTQAFAWCIGDGCAARLSINNGSKNTSKSHNCIGTGIVATFVCSVILLLAALFLREPILRLFGASDNTIEMAVDYFTIVLWFFPLYMLTNMMNAVIRADGSPAFSMLSMASGAVLNIILDPIFIFACHWGIKGAAWATVIGQTVSFVICVVYFFRSKTFKLTLKSFIPDFKELLQSVKLGLSSFITQMSIVIISLVCNIMMAEYGAMSKFGPDIPIAAISIETKVFTIVINIVVGIVLGGQPIFGYNIGAELKDRVKKTYLIILIATVAVGLLFTAIIEIWPQAIIGIFGEGDALYQEYAALTFRIFLMLVTLTSFIKMTSIFFQSIGSPVKAVISSLTRDLLCFVPLIILMPMLFEKNEAGSGVVGLLWAAPIADGVGSAVSLILTLIHFAKFNKAPLPAETASIRTAESVKEAGDNI